MNNIFDCIRINRNGLTIRCQFCNDTVKQWLETNQKLYPNWAFMINGKIEYNGIFTPTEVIILEHQYLLYKQYENIEQNAFFCFDSNSNINFKI